MAAQQQLPGGAYLNETVTAQQQTPGGPYVNETQGAAPPPDVPPFARAYGPQGYLRTLIGM